MGVHTILSGKLAYTLAPEEALCLLDLRSRRRLVWPKAASFVLEVVVLLDFPCLMMGI